jgi:hypothetical protein
MSQSQRPNPAGGEPFLPFQPPAPAPAAPTASSAGSPQSKLNTRAETKPDFTPLDPRQTQTHAHGHGHGQSTGSAQPVVTLQRDGERISTIRIECVCGQVIELACSYENNPLAP